MPIVSSSGFKWRSTCSLKTVRATTSSELQPSGLARPEIVDPRIADVETLARWLDYAFVLPGGFRFGFAPFLDLIPGIGDVIDAVLSLYIVLRAIQLGIPRVALTRMVVNIGIETVAGSLPFAGALFDSVFKANRRNFHLVQAHVYDPHRQPARDWFFLLATALILLAGLAIPVLLFVQLLKHL
jgi:hypothetical protein